MKCHTKWPLKILCVMMHAYDDRNEEMQSIRALETKEVSEKVMKAKFIHKVRVSSLLTPALYISIISIVSAISSLPSLTMNEMHCIQVD